ncbi:hypothetical protein PAPYR_12133 [Paratrimastix pyriformis]|uniref:Uncharacterized protein n=1 Tax=Paratrimastix pyriformis TaxID=342808 RepID=A0ABQ8U9A0_9EUKA|nr:hypothetical protein PAPYR_12133 [Paratrimastix pyriformis]
MHIAEENHLSDFQAHFLKEHAQCGKREVFLEFFNRAEEDDLVFHDLDHISTFKNSMLDEFCKLFGHLGFSSGAFLRSGSRNYCPRLCGSAISSIETTLHHLILATLRHPQLTTLLNLQLRQKVFLRVPISVVGTGRVHSRSHSSSDSSATRRNKTPRSRVRSRSPKHADAKGGSPRPSAKKAARTEATSTRKLPASPPARCRRPASAPCRHGVGPGGMEGDQGHLRGSPAPTKPAAASRVFWRPSTTSPLLALLTLLRPSALFLCLPNLVCRSWHFSWLRASTVYVLHPRTMVCRVNLPVQAF